MPLQDDATVPNDATLLRVLHKTWVTGEGENRRPAKHAFMDSNFETSLFVNSPEVVTELRRIFIGLEIACISVGVLREAGLVIERRPDECPEAFNCDPRCHVVIGPPNEMTRNVYQRIARTIAKHPQTRILG
jgi:hypothetical protein